MSERKVCTTEYLESEAIGALWLMRAGLSAVHAFDLQCPEGSSVRDAQRAMRKLESAYAVEAGDSGVFSRMPVEPARWGAWDRAEGVDFG